MLDLSKSEHRELLLKAGVSKAKIDALHEKQKKGEKLANWIWIDTVDGRKLVRMPESPEEVEKRTRLYENIKKMKRKKEKEYFKKMGFKNHSEYRNFLAKNKGFESYSEYRDDFIRKMGFANYNEYRNSRRYEREICLPMNVNEDCPLWLGVHIAERILPDIFENPERMRHGNSGYDFVCKNGYKIDVKSSCLYRGKFLGFHIRQNKISDFFLLIGFDNRYDLNVLCMMLIRGTDFMNNRYSTNRKLNSFDTLAVTNSEKGLRRYEKYKLSEDKLNKAKKICEEFKEFRRMDLS